VGPGLHDHPQFTNLLPSKFTRAHALKEIAMDLLKTIKEFNETQDYSDEKSIELFSYLIKHKLISVFLEISRALVQGGFIDLDGKILKKLPGQKTH
jgi:hypothetical protein